MTEQIEKLSAELRSYIQAAVAKYHEQEKGVKITDLVITQEVTNPPGVKYNIRVGVNVTFPEKKSP